MLSTRRIFNTWWPLAASWLMMSIELPALSAIVARLPNPEINLAAYGGVVFPISLIIESPIIMLLAASVALSKDWASYQKIRRFMHSLGAILTALHILIAFTPLYDVVASGILGAPAEILEPARIGLRIMTPWTWSIAYRRFNQGVMIRFNRSKAVGIGTMVRVFANLAVLGFGYWRGDIPGIIVAASAVACGVMAEALYAGLAVQPVLRDDLRNAQPVPAVLTLGTFLHFYVPLAMTSLLTLVVNPIGSAAMARMPLVIESLAVWSVVNGLGFMLRSIGLAYNEVVVALLDQPGAARPLLRFAHGLALFTTLVILLVAATPLAHLWFEDVSALKPQLAAMATAATWITLPLPALAVYQSWFQGAILHGKKTRGISEAVAIYLVVCAVLLGIGAAWGRTTGLYVSAATFGIAMLAQTAWLYIASRPVLRQLQQEEEKGNKAYPLP